jgi:non-ribosomal peptide synthetase component F
LAYLLKIFSSEDVTGADRVLAVQRFRTALEAALGDAALVLPCYDAYQKLWLLYGDHPRPWPVSPAEQLLAEQWEAAELAATQAAFGPDRYLGDADFEIQTPR